MSNDRIAGGALLALAVLVALQSRSYPFGTLAEPGPGYLPFLLALFLAAFSVLVMVRGGHSKLFSRAQFPDGGKALAILAGLAFCALAIETLGYRLTITALLVYYLGVVERKHPAIVAAVALGMALGSFYLFNTLLRVPLPVGPWRL